MANGWKTKNGKKWGRKSAIRAARLFRAHVRTPSNPKGEIVRQPCIYHPYVLGEWHHPNHRRPFFGAWLCGWAGMNCHRNVHLELLELPKEKLIDYLPLVRHKLKRGLWKTKHPNHSSKRNRIKGAAPF